AITWDTTTDPEGNVGITITRANVVLAVNSRLLFFNTTSSTDGNQPQRMYWTEVNDFDRVETNNFINLDYSHSPIISASLLGSGLIACYKTDSVVTIQNTGDPPFLPRFRAMIGLLAPKARTEHPDGDFFVGTTGFYIYSAGRIIPIGEDRVVSYFFSNLNYSAKENVYCFTDFGQREIYILFPTGTSIEPNKILVYNWNYDNWAEWDFNAFCGFYQYRTISPPVTYFGTTGGMVKKLSGTTDNGAQVTSSLRTKAFSSVPSESSSTVADYVHVTDVRTDADGSVVVSVSDTGTGTFQDVVKARTVEGGKAPRADFSVFGRYVIVGATSFNEVSEFIVSWNEAGET
ncbi:MAG: hypothetical protein QW303_02945, partial [Nitrososphaerota archaeon]